MSDKVLVVIPCYNEEKRLPVKIYLDFVKQAAPFHFLFVNDGSMDKTQDVLESMKQACPEKIEILSLQKNSGKAEAVRRGVLQGIQSGKFNFIAFWDADLATPLDMLPNFLVLFHQRPHLNIVMGARVKLLGRKIERKVSRHYLGRVFATAASILLDLSVYDTQCGAKMFRVNEHLIKMFAERFKTNWIFDVEFIARYMQLHRNLPRLERESTLCEIPLPEWRDVRGSKIKPYDFIRSFFDLFKIYFTYR